MKRLRPCTLGLFFALSLSACAGSSRSVSSPVEQDELALTRVVLYRSGVGYFERTGTVENGVLRLRVRKDHINDLLKSLTIVDRGGKALSVSMPLDPQHWAAASLAQFEGTGRLAQTLDALRGTEVTIRSDHGRISGRIMMVELIENTPMPAARTSRSDLQIQPEQTQDYLISLLHGNRIETARLSRVEHIVLQDGDLAMQLHRSLDAGSGEGMFHQVDLEIRLSSREKSEVVVSYVAQAPTWKPTYRVVLPQDGSDKGLLQGWAVVDNTSGEDWRDVGLSLTAGAPIAFEYDLYTPRTKSRVDMTGTSDDKQVRVDVGQTSFAEAQEGAAEDMEMEEAMAPAEAEPEADEMRDEAKSMPSRSMTRMKKEKVGAAMGGARPSAMPATPQEFASTMAVHTQAKQVSGLVQIDLEDLVTVPDGSSTMVGLINREVAAQENLLFKPGGAGRGYEQNPYRVVRFTNATPFALEPGPIAIYAAGSFVGEGLTDSVSAGAMATIPFAVESGILVRSSNRFEADDLRLTKVSRGVLEVEQFSRTVTVWEVSAQAQPRAMQLLIEQPRAGGNYQIVAPTQGVEQRADAYVVSVPLEKGQEKASVEVVEQTPSRHTLSIWDGNALPVLELALASAQLDPGLRAQLQPVVELRREIGRIDTLVDGLSRQQSELDRRAEETRRNLEAIKKDAAASSLRQRLSKRLEEFTKEADAHGRQLVELNAKRLEAKISLEEAIDKLSFEMPATTK